MSRRVVARLCLLTLHQKTPGGPALQGGEDVHPVAAGDHRGKGDDWDNWIFVFVIPSLMQDQSPKHSICATIQPFFKSTLPLRIFCLKNQSISSEKLVSKWNKIGECVEVKTWGFYSSIFEYIHSHKLQYRVSPSENQGFLRATLKSKKENGVGENRIWFSEVI